jgi:hypothetical protein
MGVRTGYKYDIINQVDMILYDFECLKIGKIPPKCQCFLGKMLIHRWIWGYRIPNKPPLEYHGNIMGLTRTYHGNIIGRTPTIRIMGSKQ